MKYIDFNNETLSKLCLGTVQFGLNYGIANTEGKPSQNKINTIINFVNDQGINLLDTAQGYGDSEKVIGEYTKSSSRTNHIISKIDPKEIELSASDIITTVEESIEHLNTDCLFGLLMHNSQWMDKWDEGFSNKVKLLKNRGLIKYFGVSIYTSQEFEMALANDDISIIQVPFNIFDQRALTYKWFEKAEEKNKLVVVRSIYLQGLLLMDISDIPNNLQKSVEYVKKFEKICAKLELTKNELCLSFVDSVSKNSPILFGCETINQAEENLRTYTNIKRLNNNVINEINSIFKDMDEEIYNPTKW